jgi:hypothetical protein
MLWLKAESLTTLGITTATRKGFDTGAWVAEGAGVPQALKSINNTKANSHANFFIFFSFFYIAD